MTFNLNDLLKWSARGVRLSKAQVADAGWVRTGGNEKFSRWRHASGWRLEHCGHPTALWPWALYNPQGEMVCTGITCEENRDPRNGTAWPNLASAMMFVTQEA